LVLEDVLEIPDEEQDVENHGEELGTSTNWKARNPGYSFGGVASTKPCLQYSNELRPVNTRYFKTQRYG
jgi:hypothetical protein